MNDEIMCFTFPRLLVPVNPEKQVCLDPLLTDWNAEAEARLMNHGHFLAR